jgi:hypothetical protein
VPNDRGWTVHWEERRLQPPALAEAKGCGNTQAELHNCEWVKVDNKLSTQFLTIAEIFEIGGIRLEGAHPGKILITKN